MKARILFAALFLLATVAFAGAAGDQPNMKAARAHLQTAKRELQLATPDKGGHRVNAISLINQALAEVNAGIAFDRRNNHVSSVTVETSATPDQPHMERAKNALESAKNSLERASADKGGHRQKALDLVKDAIDQVNKGIAAGRS
jgi:methanogenic corrinoid protein MtbC1